MPRVIDVLGEQRVVATECELLEFANEIRKAGGGDLIEALLSSVPKNPDSCLIANALNFRCSVETTGARYADGSYQWIMVLPNNLTYKQRESLGSVKGVRLLYRYHLLLPKHIGNAAEAFDYGCAFQEYAREAA